MKPLRPPRQGRISIAMGATRRTRKMVRKPGYVGIVKMKENNVET
jgi:hypothetical protein